jgi:hypothetical protein
MLSLMNSVETGGEFSENTQKGSELRPNLPSGRAQTQGLGRNLGGMKRKEKL